MSQVDKTVPIRVQAPKKQNALARTNWGRNNTFIQGYNNSPEGAYRSPYETWADGSPSRPLAPVGYDPKLFPITEAAAQRRNYARANTYNNTPKSVLWAKRLLCSIPIIFYSIMSLFMAFSTVAVLFVNGASRLRGAQSNWMATPYFAFMTILFATGVFGVYRIAAKASRTTWTHRAMAVAPLAVMMLFPRMY